MTEQELRSWLTLLMVPGVGPTRFRTLVEYFGSPDRVLKASSKGLSAVHGIDEKTATSISNFREQGDIDRQIKAIRRCNAKVITYRNDDYPQLLKEIYDPPPLLFVRGSLDPKDRFAVSIVGTRSPTPYGRLAAEKLSKGLSEKGITVVSGMARGIDSLVHRTVLASGGRTIAVLGCGVDITYPPENRGLRDSIIDQGAVVSEFTMGTGPDASNFPKRNRLISGLSLGVIVIEAGEKSGALLTVQSALEQNREIFAVPGNIDSAKSRGTNRLIKQGAKLVETVDDVIEELEAHLKPLIAPEKLVLVPEDLSHEEKLILENLGSEPKHIDKLTGEINLPAGQLLSILLSLELTGLVKQLPGKSFVRTF